ncbi:hypothetical protein Hanom_Chr13g01202401 [Helianthus anomalus]
MFIKVFYPYKIKTQRKILFKTCLLSRYKKNILYVKPNPRIHIRICMLSKIKHNHRVFRILPSKE